MTGDLCKVSIRWAAKGMRKFFLLYAAWVRSRAESEGNEEG